MRCWNSYYKISSPGTVHHWIKWKWDHFDARNVFINLIFQWRTCSRLIWISVRVLVSQTLLCGLRQETTANCDYSSHSQQETKDDFILGFIIFMEKINVWNWNRYLRKRGKSNNPVHNPYVISVASWTYNISLFDGSNRPYSKQSDGNSRPGYKHFPLFQLLAGRILPLLRFQISIQ